MTFHLEEECTRELYKLAGQTGTTLFMLFLAALNILLSRYSSQEDIIIGTTTAGRDHIDVQNIMGLFIETLALRNKPVGDKRFITFLKEVKENTLNAFENEAYPFRELMEKLGAANDIGRNPLFNVMLIVQNIDMTRLEIEGLTFTPVDFRSTDSKVDFTVEVFEDETGIRFNLEYSTALFRKDTMQRLAIHFINILKEVVTRPAALLSEIDMLGERERVQLLEEFSGSDYEKPVDMSLKVHQLFEKQAELTPGHIAVVFAEKQMTYRELNEKADALSEIIKGL
jgi:non-ribosomal peptide synthetase component F